MPQDPIRSYLNAKAKFDTENQKIQNLRKQIAYVAEKLNDPIKFSVSNSGVNFPSEVLNGHFPELKAEDWPSAKQIAESLISLDKAYSEAESAWSNLCAEDRVNLVELPSRREIQA